MKGFFLKQRTKRMRWLDFLCFLCWLNIYWDAEAHRSTWKTKAVWRPFFLVTVLELKAFLFHLVWASPGWTPGFTATTFKYAKLFKYFFLFLSLFFLFSPFCCPWMVSFFFGSSFVITLRPELSITEHSYSPYITLHLFRYKKMSTQRQYPWNLWIEPTDI